jgi:RimJ/RimL family protein N-acetyltransferase
MDNLITTNFNLQPKDLKHELVILKPLEIEDRESLYTVASDPLIWQQHPIKNRYQKEAFDKFFDDAIKSGGAFLVLDARTNKPIGSSRFYDYNSGSKTIAIGYTFLARNYWGTTYNRALKKLMLDYAFTFVNTVIFHIGTDNIRSQKAIEKLGAKKNEEVEIKYLEEQKVIHLIYQIDKEAWEQISSNDSEM